MCWFYCYLSIIWLAVSSLPELTASLTWYKLDCWLNCILLNCGKLGETAGHRVKSCRFSFEISSVFAITCLKVSCLRKTAKTKKCLDWIRYFDFACFFSLLTQHVWLSSIYWYFRMWVSIRGAAKMCRNSFVKFCLLSLKINCPPHSPGRRRVCHVQRSTSDKALSHFLKWITCLFPRSLH